MEKSSFFSWWIKNPVAANLAMLMLLITGVLSYCYFVEKEPTPTFPLPIMQVQFRWDGASPSDIEDQILVRVEEAVKNLEGVKEIKSNGWQGGGRVRVFAKERVDREKFSDGVREAVNAINGLPADADALIVKELNTSKSILSLALYGPVDEIIINRHAREIRRELAALSNVSAVETQGDRSEQIAIEIPEENLHLYNISFDEISKAIRNNSVNMSAGQIRSETGSVQLSIRGRAENKASFEDIVLRRSPEGAVLRLGDVANVVTGLGYSWSLSAFDGQSAVLLNVMSGDRMDIPATSKAVREYVNQKQILLPENLELDVWYDLNDAYTDRTSLLFWNAMGGLFLVVILLVLFLQLKVALWVSAGIATAFASSFVLMPLFDVSLTMISMFAFLMVIGIVVDDAIVIGESIHSENEKGSHGDLAALNGVTKVAKPVVFGVMTTMIVFAPMAFLPGTTSEFTRSISIIVCLALAFSLFESLCILPSHLRHLKKADKKDEASTLASLQKKISGTFDRLIQQVYLPLINACLSHRLSVILFFIGLFSLAVLLVKWGFVKDEFMPEIVDDRIKLTIVMPESISQARGLQVLEQVDEGVSALRDYAQRTLSPDKTNIIQHTYSQLRGTTLITIIKLGPEDERGMDINQMANKLRELISDIPDAEEIEFKTTLNSLDPRLSFNISSTSNEALALAAIDLKTHLAKYEGVYLVRDNLDRGGIEYVFSLKPEAESLGLTLREVGSQIRQAYAGQEVQRLPQPGGDSRIRVRYPEQDRASLQTLERVRIRTSDGREIPLMSVVDITSQPGIQTVVRRNGVKVAQIRAEYAGNNIGLIKPKLKKEFLPDWKKRHPEVNWGSGTRWQEEEEFLNTVYKYEGIALLVIYMLIAIAFRSYVQPLLLMCSIPFAYMGAIFGHLLHGVDYGMFSILGVLAAAGVVINDNLVLVDCINRLRAGGENAWNAVKRAGALRFRAIMLTSITTFVGLLPLMSAQSVQAQFLIPMVVSLAYGVLAATFVTLILVPCIYVSASKFGAWVVALYQEDGDISSAKQEGG